jgi:hypothetical protein
VEEAPDFYLLTKTWQMCNTSNAISTGILRKLYFKGNGGCYNAHKSLTFCKEK